MIKQHQAFKHQRLKNANSISSCHIRCQPLHCIVCSSSWSFVFRFVLPITEQPASFPASKVSVPPSNPKSDVLINDVLPTVPAVSGRSIHQLNLNQEEQVAVLLDQDNAVEAQFTLIIEESDKAGDENKDRSDEKEQAENNEATPGFSMSNNGKAALA